MKKIILLLLALMMAGCVWSRYPRRMNRVEVEINSPGDRHEQQYRDEGNEHGDHGDGRHGQDDHH